MHVLFSVPMLGIHQHFGMSIGEFTTKHLRLGNYIFTIGDGCRRFIPQAMCLIEEVTDEEWAKREKAQAEAASDEAKKKQADDEAKKAEVRQKAIANAAWQRRFFLARLFTRKPYPEVK